ncbi:hypothetical protein STAQ_25450 [Allostella sp. ATCC 35155]|nr:hypothetical protein STAQ_25450 [Stella sp. ATCC 35155]
MHTNFASDTTALSGRPHSEAGLHSLSFRRGATNERKLGQPGLSPASLRKIVLDLIG